MSLVPRLFTSTGRGEVRQARIEVDPLVQKQGKGLLRGHEQKRLEGLRSIIRRDLFDKLAVVGLGVVVTAGGIAFMTKPAEKADHKTADVADVKDAETPELSEEQLDQLISRVEESFLEWEPIIRDHIQKAGGLPPGATEEHFYAPFHVLSINKQNALKSARILKRVHAEKSEVKMADPNYFVFDTFDQMRTPLDRSQLAAAFSPASRTLFVDSEIDPQSPFDMLVLYHELMHAVQDAILRARIQSPQEFELYKANHSMGNGQKMRINGVHEIDAYGSELEIADLMMGGRLRNGTATMDDMIGVFRPRPNQIATVQLLHGLSTVYFPHGISNGAFDPRFVAVIRKMYADMGYEVYLQQ